MLIILYCRETVTLPKLFTTYHENENVNRVLSAMAMLKSRDRSIIRGGTYLYIRVHRLMILMQNTNI